MPSDSITFEEWEQELKDLNKSSKVTEERLIEILRSDYAEIPEECNVFLGLKIITKYLPKQGIEGADHDVVFSSTLTDIVAAGITEEDAIKLRKLNWMVDESGTGLACFV